jgi:hypothetical protein
VLPRNIAMTGLTNVLVATLLGGSTLISQQWELNAPMEPKSTG